MATIKIATYNMNNLFERTRIMELEGFSEKSKEVLGDVSKLNELLQAESYAGETGEQIVKILNKYFHDTPGNPWFRVNEVREKLFSMKRDGTGAALKAKGRKDWVGWVELVKQKTNEVSLENTARVVKAVNPDILCTVEVDNRIALNNFNNFVIKKPATFKHAMVIDGNDERGIDVGVLSKFEILSMTSHVDDVYTDANGRKRTIFSRDCPEYNIKVKNRQLHLLCNHFKSKGYGSQQSSNARRKRQADRVVEILQQYDLTTDWVAVAGDFNDTPGSLPLKNLLTLPGLHDVLDWPGFTGERWTYHTGSEQIDYLLVSTPLFENITDVGIERRGIFRRNNESFPQVTNKVTQASDHACVWAAFDV
jgi:endonuclease/exonuclease/phosphatase family metal-dependent hydrolase